MSDADCVRFLQWALPRLGLQWSGFRRVRGMVCKRVARRLRALGLADLDAYRALLERDSGELRALDALCTIPVSRFWRDRTVFEQLEREVLPALARDACGAGRDALECWSAGCAGGEEPYTLAILWHVRLRRHFPGLAFHVLGTDIEPALLARARRGCYRGSSLKELPPGLREEAFERPAELDCVRRSLRAGVAFECRDVRAEPPRRSFDLILCRNVVLTYFGPRLRDEVMRRLIGCLRPGGALVVGLHEVLPTRFEALAPWPGQRAIWRKRLDRDQAASRGLLQDHPT